MKKRSARLATAVALTAAAVAASVLYLPEVLRPGCSVAAAKAPGHPDTLRLLSSHPAGTTPLGAVESSCEDGRFSEYAGYAESSVVYAYTTGEREFAAHYDAEAARSGWVAHLRESGTGAVETFDRCWTRTVDGSPVTAELRYDPTARTYALTATSALDGSGIHCP
ncbi:hypothetical protein KNE206_58230 [Kitasatospora sp. NE20-6]|uniref:hypothetical protein n=1 Tax=Kitasatospora sp. NE20-6 TaxID=2859066 RepID=UPI0034DBE080